VPGTSYRVITECGVWGIEKERRIWLIGYRQTINQPYGYATMSKGNVIELEGRAGITDPLTELLRTGARQLLQQAIEAEVQELLGVLGIIPPKKT
jgi:hypothetical protein